MKLKIIVVTGGVYSSLGKGIISSSLGRILTELNQEVSIMKFDPYLNVDIKNISPLQHGEIFITKDGKETDLDIGNYERFLGKDLDKNSSISSGMLYEEIIINQKNNKYAGNTIQVVPHMTDLIIEKILKHDNNKNDFLIIEIGGTIGDIESIPFIESLNRFVFKYGKENIMFAHCVPVLSNKSVTGELKTKPAQHSIRNLRSLGITPDILFLRSEDKLEKEVVNKISNLVLINQKDIFTSFNLENSYFLVDHLFNENIHKKIFKYFKLDIKKQNLEKWNDFSNSIKNNKYSKTQKNILVLGDYVALLDAYFSIIESINLTSYFLNIKNKISFMDKKEFEECSIKELNKFDGIINSFNSEPYYDVNKLFNIDKPILNINNSIFSILKKINLDKFISKNNNKGEKELFFEDKTLIKERTSSEFIILKDIVNNSKDIQKILSNNEELFAFKLKNKKYFMCVNGSVEFSSKPNNPDWFFIDFFKKL